MSRDGDLSYESAAQITSFALECLFTDDFSAVRTIDTFVSETAGCYTAQWLSKYDTEYSTELGGMRREMLMMSGEQSEAEGLKNRIDRMIYLTQGG